MPIQKKLMAMAGVNVTQQPQEGQQIERDGNIQEEVEDGEIEEGETDNINGGSTSPRSRTNRTTTQNSNRGNSGGQITTDTGRKADEWPALPHRDISDIGTVMPGQRPPQTATKTGPTHNGNIDIRRGRQPDINQYQWPQTPPRNREDQNRRGTRPYGRTPHSTNRRHMNTDRRDTSYRGNDGMNEYLVSNQPNIRGNNWRNQSGAGPQNRIHNNSRNTPNNRSRTQSQRETQRQYWQRNAPSQKDGKEQAPSNYQTMANQPRKTPEEKWWEVDKIIQETKVQFGFFSTREDGEISDSTMYY